jgi:HAD superfamily hydrolase (TIGR01509 family)
MLKAIFWDNDGILVDTEHLYYQACRETLQRVGIELSLPDFVRLTLDLGRSPVVLAAQQGFSAAEAAALRDEKNRRYAELLQNGAEPMAGALETLAVLHDKVVMGIVTSSRKDHFDLIHRKNGLLSYFDFILTREDYRYSKPNPEPYLKALARSKLAPSECLVVEDTRRGLQAALGAGLRCIVVPNRLAPDGDFPGAYRILPDLDRVREFLLKEELPAGCGPLLKLSAGFRDGRT